MKKKKKKERKKERKHADKGKGTPTDSAMRTISPSIKSISVSFP